MMTNAPTTLTIKGHEYVLESVRPAYAEDLWAAYMDRASSGLGLHRIYAAAIAVRAPRVRQVLRLPDPDRVHLDLVTYGGQVYDALAGQGLSRADVEALGLAAMRPIFDDRISEEAIQDEEDFTEPTL